MTRPTYAQIDCAALVHNYRYAKELTKTKAFAVLKADAYGHGAVTAARALQSVADGFAVACLEEAIELREAGIVQPILLLQGFFEVSELDLLETYNLWTVLHHKSQIELFLQAKIAPLKVFLKLDSGMHRLGLNPAEYRIAYEQLIASANCTEIVHMTHLARADELDCPATSAQLALFAEVTQGLSGACSMANSPAILAWPESHGQPKRGDWARPGFMLYGGLPLDRAHPAAEPLQPVMHLYSAITSIRELAAGEPIGYGARFICSRLTRVAVVAIGYGDGYPRHAKEGTPVWINGRICSLIGRVSMDMLTVDVSALADVSIGDRVELWGANLPINQVARACDTIAYELMTQITPRVPRLA